MLGLCGSALQALIAPYNDYVIRGVFSSGGHFPVFPFFAMAILILMLNVVLRVIQPSLGLSPQELITIWCLMAVASGIPCSGLMRYSLSPLVAYQYFATPENEWKALFHQHIPHWRVLHDDRAINSFYQGISAGESIPWSAWMTPLSIWTIYVFTIYLVMICLSELLRKQWIEHERCIFPLVQLPLEVAASPRPASNLNSFFSSRAMWIGLAVPVAVHALNCLHTFFPYFPSIPLEIWLNPFLRAKPWQALSPFKVFLVWSVVGFSYLLTLEVSFSLWFFFLLFKFQCLIGGLLGFRLSKGPGVQWTGYSFSAAQEAGACLTFVLLLLWKTRRHLRQMLTSAFSGPVMNADNTEEAISSRWTILGLMGGISLLIFLNHLMGMSYIFALTFVCFLLATYIVLTWQVINGGIPFINPSFSPQSFFLATLGPSRIQPSTTTSLFMHSISLTLDLREFMMPYVMNGLKAGEEVRLRRRPLLLAMATAMVLAVLLSYYSVLQLCYRQGAINLMAGASGHVRQLASILAGPQTGTDWTNTGFIMLGGLFLLLLVWMRNLFVWWPLHPIGYTMFSSWATFQLWFSIMLGWAVKYGVLKYGGLKVYRQIRPVFLGLVLGEVVCAGIWMIISLIAGGTTTYRILWF